MGGLGELRNFATGGRRQLTIQGYRCARRDSCHRLASDPGGSWTHCADGGRRGWGPAGSMGAAVEARASRPTAHVRVTRRARQTTRSFAYRCGAGRVPRTIDPNPFRPYPLSPSTPPGSHPAVTRPHRPLRRTPSPTGKQHEF